MVILEVILTVVVPVSVGIFIGTLAASSIEQYFEDKRRNKLNDKK